MPYTGHVRKRTTKSGITTYQVIVEEESSLPTENANAITRPFRAGKNKQKKSCGI